MAAQSAPDYSFSTIEGVKKELKEFQEFEKKHSEVNKDGVWQRFLLFGATLINTTILPINSISIVAWTNRYIEF